VSWRSQTLAYYLALERTDLLVAANDIAMHGDNPPPLAFPFRRKERCMERSAVAEIERARSRMDYTRSGRLDFPAAVRGIAVLV
jgi:hypothetical protein